MILKLYIINMIKFTFFYIDLYDFINIDFLLLAKI